MGDKKLPDIPIRFPFPPPSVQYPARYGPPVPPTRYQYPPPMYYDQCTQQYTQPTFPTNYPTEQQYNKPYTGYEEPTVAYETTKTYDDTTAYNYANYNQSIVTDYTTNYYNVSNYTQNIEQQPIETYVTTREKYDKTTVISNVRKPITDDNKSLKSRHSEKSLSKSYSSHRSRVEKCYSRCSRSRSRSRKSRHHERPKSRERVKKHYPIKKTTPKLSSQSERDIILEKWRKNYCATSEEVSNKLEELSKLTQEEILEREKSFWTRTTPADLYYARDEDNHKIIRGTPRLHKICERFKEDLVLRAQKVNQSKPEYEPPQRKKRTRLCKHKSEPCHSDSSSNDGFSDEEEENIMEELTRKQQHPDRLHQEMWYNDPGEMNDGPLCRCSLKSRKSGIRHGIYAGEKFLKLCDKDTNNATNLYHYKITISPPTNFLTKTPTIIKHDEHEFIFEGFSMFSHFPLVKLPTCKVIRFNIEYTILYIEEKHPDNFTIRELDMFQDFLFRELLELVDLDFHAAGDMDGCSQFHFMPRFVRELPDNGREILSMKEVLQYLLDSSKLLISSSQLDNMVQMSQYEWQAFADDVKGMVVTYPGKKPCSVRVDQLDRNTDLQVKGKLNFPEIVHFGIRPPQLSYAGNPEYQKAWRDYVKFRHLLANMSKPTFEDKRKLEAKEGKLQEMRTQSKMKRDVTVAVSAEGFYKTGIMCDIVQHAMLIPVLVCHLRFHHSLNILENNIGYKFENRALLQLALTHPSYRENFGTNPDHARNSLTNCGIRQPEYGDRRIHYMNTRKRGINTLINIMSRFGKKHETESNITHNERLEFLGDAVVEFLSSIHLFLMFPDLEEGGLATYRAAIVQNQHLAVLARILDLDQFMLYAHGSDLCHDLELRHAMANCFEALMGALFLDGGIEIADKVFGTTLFKKECDLLEVWENLPPHPLQEQEPAGDRQWIPKFEVLQKLTKFEGSIGVQFSHIRLLARAFTDRSIGYTNLTLGSNQRLEFLGDTVLQLIASEYLYKYFPEHHEGHLSLLRSSLVNNRTQAVVCDDLGMANYAVYNNPKAELKTKDRADLLEAFIGALYIDQDLEYCRVFCQVTLFPRLQDFIMNQDWNDPKSKLQQCCLTLRTMDGGEPDIPVYKVIECKGPTNTRVYTVAVYFRNKRLAKATGHSIQQAEMNSAKKALEISQDLFPQLDHQKRVIAKSMKRQKYPNRPKNDSDSTDSDADSQSSSRRSRSRSRNATSAKSRSNKHKSSKYESRSRKRPRSNSRENSSRNTSRSKENSCSRNNSNSRENSRSRNNSKSRNSSRSSYNCSSRENSRSRENSKSRNRSRSVERFRKNSKTRDKSHSRKLSRSRQNSHSRKPSRCRDESHTRKLSRSRDTSHSRKRSRSREKSSSRRPSRSRENSHSRKPSRENSYSRKHSSDNARSRNIYKSIDDFRIRNKSRSRENSYSRKRSRSKESSFSRNRSRSRHNSRSRNKSRSVDNSHISRLKDNSVLVNSSRSKDNSNCRNISIPIDESHSSIRCSSKESSNSRNIAIPGHSSYAKYSQFTDYSIYIKDIKVKMGPLSDKSRSDSIEKLKIMDTSTSTETSALLNLTEPHLKLDTIHSESDDDGSTISNSSKFSFKSTDHPDCRPQSTDSFSSSILMQE